MDSFLASFLSLFAKPSFLAIVDILLTAFLIYQILMIIRGRRAAHVLAGITVLGLLYLMARMVGLSALRAMLETIAPYSAIALIVVFQSEIRRLLARIGRRGWLGLGGRLKTREWVEEVKSALEYLAKGPTGALIVIERDVGLRTFIESGVSLDALVSRDLLLAVFHPKGALHDGAAIIQNGRLVAAACFLPLSMNPTLTATMGTRHRAAIGITEDTDCLALVVSEETGKISAASFGNIRRDLTIEEVDEIITAHLKSASDGHPQAAESGETGAALRPAKRS